MRITLIFFPSKLSESSFAWKRRSDLRGRTVTAITKKWPPFVVSVQVVRYTHNNRPTPFLLKEMFPD